MFEMEYLKYYTKAEPKNIDQNTLFLTNCRPNTTQKLSKLSYFPYSTSKRHIRPNLSLSPPIVLTFSLN